VKFQLVINMERLSPETDMSEVARHTLDMVQMAERAGFESVWAAEHHSNELLIAPNPFQILTWWAAHTSRIRLGAAVVVAPFWHPVDVAGEAALLDVYSSGRLDFGIGSGAMQREFDRMKPGVVQPEGYRYVQEMLPALKALWVGDYAHDGEFWSFPTSTSVPKPIQQPYPPIWLTARAPVTFDFAVKNQCNIMSWALSLPFSEVELLLERLETALRDNPGCPRPIFATMRYTAVVENEVQLDEVVAATYEHMARIDTLRKNIGGVTRGFAEPAELSEFAGLDPVIGRDDLVRNLMFGTPAEIIAKLKEYQDLGVDQYTYGASYGLNMVSQKRSLELFIKEVMPEFDESESKESYIQRTA